MSLNLNRTMGKGVAIALVGIVSMATFLLLLRPLLVQYRDNQHEIAKLSRQLISYERIADSRGEVEKTLSEIGPDADVPNYYLQGSTRALASAELQAYVRTVIEASDGDLLSTQPIAKGDDASGREVKVNVRMSGTVEALVQVLYRISSGVPVLLTDEVLILRGRGGGSRQAKAGRDGNLEIHFTLTGFVKQSVL